MYKITQHACASTETSDLGRYFFKEPFIVIPIRRLVNNRFVSGVRVHKIGMSEAEDSIYMIDGSCGTLQLPGGKRDEGNVTTASELILPVLTNGTHGPVETFHIHLLHITGGGISNLCQGQIPNPRVGSAVSCKFSGDTFLVRDGACWFYSAKVVLKPHLSISFGQVNRMTWDIDQAQYQSGARRSKIGFIEWDKAAPTQSMSLSLYLF